MNNPPAFPQHPVFDATERVEFGGMTLRDYFAAAAMQGNIASGGTDILLNGGPEQAAKLAYQTADAMLKAREQ